jgi:3-phenylpropionate/trans-cinnamate dioxygenase ferredoxin subunit
MGAVRVAGTAEIQAGSMRQIDVDGEAVLVANVGGTYYAIANTCSHQGGNLSRGTIENGVVTCPRHGSQFDVTTGKAVGKAKVAFIKVMPKDEKSYAVKVEGTDIMLETG